MPLGPTRRNLLLSAGASLVALDIGSHVFAQAQPQNLDFSAPPQDIAQFGGGWKYAPIDPQKAADDSYTLFAEGACHYASFRAIVTNVAHALPEQDAEYAKTYLAFPFYMMVYGQAGLAFYGSLCGALNGCCAAISVFVPNKDDKFSLIQELSLYYENTPLPIYVPKEDKYPGKMPPNPAKSVLCHISLDNWIKSSGTTLEGYTRVERCIRLTCDTVAKTVDLLNQYHASRKKTVAALMPLLPETQSCMQCHSDKTGRYDSLAKMDCAVCHPQPAVERSCLRK